MSDMMAHISASTDGLAQEFSIIAHNLANLSTVGYKRRCNSFSQSLQMQKQQVQPETSGVGALRTTFDFSQGDTVETGRPLDLALYGKGFFVIETPNGPLYTRKGIFHINHNSQIVDSQGRTVAGERGPITIPLGAGPSQLHVSSEGKISVAATGAVAGKLKLVDFGENEDKLVPVGASCFQLQDDTEPDDAENVVVKQGYHEASNVKMTEELVDMIMVQRLYEANMKFLSAAKDVSSSIIDAAMG